MKTGPVKIETMEVPREFLDLATRRTKEFVRHRLNVAATGGVLDVPRLAAECYAQGLWDGFECVAARPEILRHIGPVESEGK